MKLAPDQRLCDSLSGQSNEPSSYMQNIHIIARLYNWADYMGANIGGKVSRVGVHFKAVILACKFQKLCLFMRGSRKLCQRWSNFDNFFLVDEGSEDPNNIISGP